MGKRLFASTLALLASVACGGSGNKNPGDEPSDAGGGIAPADDAGGQSAVVEAGGDDAALEPGAGDAGVPASGAGVGLHVVGNKLVANGATVTLRGVSHAGTEYQCSNGAGIFEGPSDDSLVMPMLGWNVNAIRVPLNQNCWLGINGVPASFSGAKYQSALTTFVKMLRSHNLYVIVDLHRNDPGTNNQDQQQPMADADHSPTFWKSVATTFMGDTGVLFDLYNEPFVDTDNAQTSDPWACWLNGCTITSSNGIRGSWQSAGMQSLVTAVRSTGATNVLVLGGLAYANDLSGWLTHMPSDPLNSLVAAFHEYNDTACSSQKCWTKTIAPVAAQVPLLTGELGEDDCGDGFIEGYMSWADGQGISYMGWAWNTWDCGGGPSLISNYSGGSTAFGAGYKAHLMSLNP
jgi:endoglucanase